MDEETEVEKATAVVVEHDANVDVMNPNNKQNEIGRLREQADSARKQQTDLDGIAITKELADTLRRNKTIDWQKRESARAKMRMLIKKLLKKHKYPPEGMEDAVQTVMTQCELWTDNNDMGEENVINFHRKSTSYAESNYAKPLMVAESEATYKVRK